MAIKVHIPVPLRRYTGNNHTVEVNGATVAECLNQLIAKFPDMKKAIFTDEEKPVAQLGIYLNMTGLGAEGLKQQVNDGDIITLIYVLTGG